MPPVGAQGLRRGAWHDAGVTARLALHDRLVDQVLVAAGLGSDVGGREQIHIDVLAAARVLACEQRD